MLHGRYTAWPFSLAPWDNKLTRPDNSALQIEVHPWFTVAISIETFLLRKFPGEHTYRAEAGLPTGQRYRMYPYSMLKDEQTAHLRKMVLQSPRSLDDVGSTELYPITFSGSRSDCDGGDVTFNDTPWFQDFTLGSCTLLTADH